MTHESNSVLLKMSNSKENEKERGRAEGGWVAVWKRKWKAVRVKASALLLITKRC